MNFSKKKTKSLYPFLLAVNRGNNYVKVIPLKNKKFDSLFEALSELKKDINFSHIQTVLSDKESAFNTGKHTT